MPDKFDGTTKLILSILFFPLFFQDLFFSWVWGAHDLFYIMLAKRFFLLLPVAAIVFGCWLTIACVVSIVIRQNRREFVSAIFVTWWDLGRAIFSFWGGILKFLFYLAGWILSFIRLVIVAFWLTIQDILLSPLRAVKGVGEGAFRPGVPWIAVVVTLLWCILEAMVFTFVMTNLVTETINNITEAEVGVRTVQVILYFMLLAFVIGSYAIVASLAAAVKSKNVGQIVLVLLVEVVALVFEVMFLYREFVDALVPWFAQYAGENFRMGIFPTLLLAATIWAGIRGMTWFLFAGSGTPTILAIIQRTGLQGAKQGGGGGGNGKHGEYFAFVNAAVERIMRDLDWVHQKGEEIASSFIVPPLQIVAGAVNFCTLLISANHLFELPFKSYKDLMVAKDLIKKAAKS